MRKSEVNMLMERMAPAVPPTPIQKLPTDQRHPASPALQGNRSPDANRMPQPQVAAAQPTAARSSFDQIIDELTAMESRASHDLLFPFPVFKSTPAMSKTKQEVRDANAKLSAARDHCGVMHSQLGSAPRVQWWCYAIGLAVRRRRQIQNLENALAAADKELQLRQITLFGREAALYREEKTAKELHAEQVRDVNRKHKNARQVLERVDLARTLIGRDPDLADKGLANLMSVAGIRSSLGVAPVPEMDFESTPRL